MNPMTYFPHAGHQHEETLTASSATLIILGIIATSVVIAAVVLIVLNAHKKATGKPADDTDE